MPTAHACSSARVVGVHPGRAAPREVVSLRLQAGRNGYEVVMNPHEAVRTSRPEVEAARVWAWQFMLSWRALLGLAVLAVVVAGVSR